VTHAAASKQAIRSTIRKQRQALSLSDQRALAHKWFTQITLSGLLLRHQHIALYQGFDGELDPVLCHSELLRQGKILYLPRLTRVERNGMQFLRFRPGTRMEKNRFGIPEPVYSMSDLIPRRFISLVLMPLVAFDENGNRLGMGGGFYARTLGGLDARLRPKLFGVAYDFQNMPSLPTEQWDVPLDGVITPSTVFEFSNTSIG